MAGRRDLRVVGGLVVGVAAVSTAAPLIRVAIGDPPDLSLALAVAFWRTFGGAVALAPLALRERARDGGRPAAARTRGRRRALAASGLFLAVHFALFLGSVALTTVASAVTLATMSPLFVAIGGRVFLGEPLTRRMALGVGATMIGAVTIGLADASGLALGGRALLGDAMAFMSALAVTGYLLIGRRVRADVPAATYSATVYGWAAVALLALVVAVGAPLGGYPAVTWAAIAGIVLGPQLLGHTMFNTLLARVSATVVSVVVLAEPIGATLIAWVAFGELPPALFWVGAPVTLAGVFVASVRRSAGAAAAR